jgi:hypothetical protein
MQFLLPLSEATMYAGSSDVGVQPIVNPVLLTLHHPDIPETDLSVPHSILTAAPYPYKHILT